MRGTDGERKSDERFRQCEYRSVTAPRGLESLYVDAYGAFGWESVYDVNSLASIGTVSLSFRRDRILKNNVNLGRLQAQCDTALRNLCLIESGRNAAGKPQAIGLGLVASLAFGCGVTLCLKGDRPILGIVVGMMGLAGSGCAYPIYERCRARRADELASAADEQYENLGRICESARSLIARRE